MKNNHSHKARDNIRSSLDKTDVNGSRLNLSRKVDTSSLIGKNTGESRDGGSIPPLVDITQPGGV